MYSFLFEQVGKHHNLENKSQKKDMKTAKKKKEKKKQHVTPSLLSFLPSQQTVIRIFHIFLLACDR